MERKKRLVLWLLSALLATALIYSGRDADHKGLPVAFLRYSSAGNIVRLKGNVPNPGIYRFPEKTKLKNVINMTAPLLAGNIANKALLETSVLNGDIIEVVAKDRQHAEITLGKMKAKERMLLGIPLDPDQMDFADWDSLPGIGPVLAQSILDDRQKYGDFISFEALQRVPGMGEKKLRSLKKYFERL
jgi:competence protein ComEA